MPEAKGIFVLTSYRGLSKQAADSYRALEGVYEDPHIFIVKESSGLRKQATLHR